MPGLVAGLPLPKRPLVTASESLSLTVDGLCDSKGEGGGVRKQRKRRTVSDKLRFRKKI